MTSPLPANDPSALPPVTTPVNIQVARRIPRGIWACHEIQHP